MKKTVLLIFLLLPLVFNSFKTVQATAAVSQPLASTSQTVTRTFSAPNYFFGNNCYGSSERSSVTYVFKPTGQVYYYNGQGENFSLGVPSAGFGAVPVTSLTSGVIWYNSTVVAMYNFTLLTYHIQVYFLVKPASCGQSSPNLEVVIVGVLPAPGTFRFPLANPKALALNLSSTRVLFGHFGFDWAQSLSFNPVFNSTSLSLSYVLPAVFRIDPTTITTVADDASMHWPFQQKDFVTIQAVFLTLCDTSNNQFRYTASIDGGLTWSGLSNIASCANGAKMETWQSNGFVYAADSDACVVANHNFCYAVSTASGTSLSFNSFTNVGVCTSSADQSAITTDGGGNVWGAERCGSTTYNVYKCTCTGMQAWVNDTSPQLTVTATQLMLVPLTSGKMAMVYYTASGGGTSLSVRTWSGSAWNSIVTTTSVLFDKISFGALGIGDNLQIVLGDNNKVIRGIVYRYGSNSFDTEQSIFTNTISGSGAYPVVSYDVASLTNYAIWYEGGGNIHYATSTNLAPWSDGGRWQTGETFTNNYDITSGKYAAVVSGLPDVIPVDWLTGAACPCNFRYASFNVPVVSNPTPPLQAPVPATADPGGFLGLSGVAVPLILFANVIFGSPSATIVLTVAALVLGLGIYARMSKDPAVRRAVGGLEAKPRKRRFSHDGVGEKRGSRLGSNVGERRKRRVEV